MSAHLKPSPSTATTLSPAQRTELVLAYRRMGIKHECCSCTHLLKNGINVPWCKKTKHQYVSSNNERLFICEQFKPA